MEKRIDIPAFLENVVRQNTRHYPSDFLYDREMLQKAAQDRDTENRTFLWMSRPSGTWCFRERDIFLRETGAHAVWTYYASQPEGIRAFRIRLDHSANGIVSGGVQELDYSQQVRRVMEKALPVQTMEVSFADGTIRNMRCEDYTGQGYELAARYGPVERVRYYPPDEQELIRVLREERRLSEPHKKQRHKHR